MERRGTTRRGWAIIALALACGCHHDHPPAASDAATPPPPSPSATAAAPSVRTVFDPLATGQSSCVLGHHGVLLDLGIPALRPELGIAHATGLEATERQGSTWERISARSLTLRFIGPTDAPPLPPDGGKAEVYVDMRVRGLGARSLSVYLNGKAIGAIRLSRGEEIRSVHSPVPSIASGDNELLLRVNGMPKGSADAGVEVDWVRVGTEPAPEYAAPTFSDATMSAAVGGVTRRALALRAPGYLRCSGPIPHGATVDLQLGVLGRGAADVEVRVLRDRKLPLVLGTYHATDQGGWRAIHVPVPEAATGTLGAVEIAAVRASEGSRVLLGEPRVTVPLPKAPPAAPARGVVLLVLGQMPPSMLSPFGGAAATPELGELMKSSYVFDGARATTTWPAGSLASMLTGLLPRDHGVVDDLSRLSSRVTTIADAARDAGVSTAYFTANPTTTAAFGFDRGWQTYAAYLPGAQGGASRVVEEATKWIAAHKSDRFLVVIHARGGHPPWDIPAAALGAMPPDGYGGAIDPVHAAEMMAKARHVPPLVRFTDDDRTRAMAIYTLAVKGQDAALARLRAGLRDAGRDGDTMLVVAGDTGLSDAARVPFGDGEPLDDRALASLMVVRPPGGVAGARVPAPVSTLDVARTVLSALGLTPPSSFHGVDLRRSAVAADDARCLDAQLGPRRFKKCFGFVWHGEARREELCDLTLDPACGTDVSESYPYAAEVMRRVTITADQDAAGDIPPREPARLDAPTLAALSVWGRL